MQNPTAGVSPAAGAPRSAPLPRVSPRRPFSPVPGALPALAPSALPVPLPCPSRDGWDEPQRGRSRGGSSPCPALHRLGEPHGKRKLLPFPLCGRADGTSRPQPSHCLPRGGRRSALAALTPPSLGLGFARPPAMAGEGRACCRAASSIGLLNPRLSRYPAERARWAGGHDRGRERSVLRR